MKVKILCCVLLACFMNFFASPVSSAYSQEEESLRNTALSYLADPQFSDWSFLEKLSGTKSKLELISYRDGHIYLSIGGDELTRDVINSLCINPKKIEFAKTASGKFQRNHGEIGHLELGGYKYYKEGNMNLFKHINFSYLFLFIFFFIALVGARSAIRLIMVLGPVGAIIASYFVVKIVLEAMKSKEQTRKIIMWIIAGIFIVTILFVFYIYFVSTNQTSKQYVPSSYNIQWQKAMGWVRENTPQDAVFGHWWDYGYWVQTL